MAEENYVIAITSVEQWTLELERGKNENKLVVIDFTASWCGPCRIMAPVFSEYAKKYPNVLFLKVDVDEMTDIVQQWEIRAMPTFIFLKDGEKVHTITGANKEELVASIVKHSKPTAEATSSAI